MKYLLLLLLQLVAGEKSKAVTWIDADTKSEDYSFPVPQGAFSFGAAGNHAYENYTLIFSDEFNKSKRQFEQGFDRRWTAISNRDYSNMGQHYFAPEAVQTDLGNLIITTTKPKKKYRGAKYLSGSVQTWNKFCFTSGFVEVRAVLPGKWGIPGTWPAMWIMGNLGRATFLDSQTGTWPWSFDYCAPWIKKLEKVSQLISACDNRTEKHDPNSIPEHYGLNPHQGRGATEIDIMEAQIKEKGGVAEISTSLQISPSLDASLRPPVGGKPGPGQWYQNLTYGAFTRVNNYYFGDDGLDSVSALTQLNPDCFHAYHLYRIDWAPGPNGYIRWWLDDNFLFEIPAASLNKWSLKVPPRQIPIEPSYLILSTAVSEKFSPPCEGQICNSIWPSNFTIDYVRVYQRPNDPYATMGCNLDAFPTKDWIQTHPVKFGMPWYITLDMDYILVNLGACLALAIGIIICFSGISYPALSAFFSGVLVFSTVAYAIFQVHLANEDPLEWMHVVLSCFCTVVLSGVGTLKPIWFIKLGFSCLVPLLLSPILPWIILLVIAAVCVVVLQFVDSSKVDAVLMSCIGAFWASLGLAQLLSIGHVVASIWFAAQSILLPTAKETITPISIYFDLVFIAFAVVGSVCQHMILASSKPHAASYGFPKVTRNPSTIENNFGYEARSWHPKKEISSTMNLLNADCLPDNLLPYSLVIKEAKNIGKLFGFQESNVRNQSEHVMILLCNSNRNTNDSDAFTDLHAKVFSNYFKWCRHLGQGVKTYVPKANEATSKIQCQFTIDICLFFLIWGESSNLRHTPEFLNFLFHKMKTEYIKNPTMKQAPGYFLDAVITPIYRVIKQEMTQSNVDHDSRRNYDDFNEYFWTAECLKYSYCEVGSTIDEGASFDFSESANLSSEKTIVEAYKDSKNKTYVEKRTWLSPFRAFRRIYAFHFIAFHTLAAIAFGVHEKYSLVYTMQMASSVLITPFILGILWDFLSIALNASEKRPNDEQNIRTVCHIIIRLVATVVLSSLYWSAWLQLHNQSTESVSCWFMYGFIAVLMHAPGILNAVLQVCPAMSTWILQSRSSSVIFVRRLITPLYKLYVGDSMLDTLPSSLGYILYWVSMLSWKLLFSFKFEILPIVQPTILLYKDHVESGVGITITAILIAIQWFPFIIVFFVDITIWNSLWMAFAGTFEGFKSRIGEIRNFDRTRQNFFGAVEAFNRKIIAKKSVVGKEMAAFQSKYYGLSNVDSEGLVEQRPDSANDKTPLLSYSRRLSTHEDVVSMRRKKWSTFSTAWNSVIASMRQGDILNNREVNMMQFHIMTGYKRQVYLPKFQLAGCFEKVALICAEFAERKGSAETNFQLEEQMHDAVQSEQMLEESTGELWELTQWLLKHVLGPCHHNDINYILSSMEGWSQRNILLGSVDFKKLQAAGNALADVVGLLGRHMDGWKANTKSIPVKKSPEDFKENQFPTSVMSGPSLHAKVTGIRKSASTTGLSMMGKNIPRRSRGSGVAKIGMLASTDAQSSTSSNHGIPNSSLSQTRDKLRAFLNIVKSMICENDAESRGVSDRLTWILTQERGFMWDDNYAGEQLTIFSFESHAKSIIGQLEALLTLRKIDAEPKSRDARRRLLFFVNSLFMDMPSSPTLEDMISWSVVTPYYGEDILYSKKDLENKQDGLDVHTLLYLQTLYKQDWENFLERVKPKNRNNLWKDSQVALELRLWASLRGQTLVRTVQGMMFGEEAIRLLAKLEGVDADRVDDLVKQKFNYVVACQIYGKHKKHNDPKAADVEFLLRKFKNLRVAYIDEVRVNYCKEHSYFTVLIKADENGNPVEVYRIRLPGNPILGEGKPENQNSAIIYTRGESLQTIDMNQDGYLEEHLKMRNVLQEFNAGTADRPYTIIGLPEHVFTGSVSSLANYMALQETSFVTLGQRTLAKPLRIRLHYGHPDVFNKIFFMARGGISKASKGINLSEDIFAGYNNCLRGGSVKFPEYAIFGKGRDVGMAQIYKFEAKLAQGAAEQSLSRDVYRIGERLDFFKLLSFYYNHVGFYLNMSYICWTVFILTYLNLLKAAIGVEQVGERTAVLMSKLQVMLGCISFLTTAPLLATISVERGFKAAAREVFMVLVTGGPLYFLFHIGTKWFYYGQTILAGGAKYRATGRGFVTKHSNFDDLFRFYASSHLYGGLEIAAALILYAYYTKSLQYFALTWSLWLVVLSWCSSPFWFNPLAFEWREASEDVSLWLRWMKGDGGNATQSWETWFREENVYFNKLKLSSKLMVACKGVLYACIGLAILTSTDSYHSLYKFKIFLPVAVTLSLTVLALLLWGVIFKLFSSETGLIRISKLLFVVLCVFSLAASLSYVDHMFSCMVAFYYFVAAIGCWLLLLNGSNSKLVQQIYIVHDYLMGAFFLSIILILSAVYVPGKIQTWLLYNNALSRGVVIEDILRSNSSNKDGDQDEQSMLQLKSIIVEQQKVISMLSTSNGDHVSNGTNSEDESVRALLGSRLESVSDNDLSNLIAASSTLTDAMVKSSPAIRNLYRTTRSSSSSDIQIGKPPMRK